jgi:hypothetical protein
VSAVVGCFCDCCRFCHRCRCLYRLRHCGC